MKYKTQAKKDDDYNETILLSETFTNSECPFINNNFSPRYSPRYNVWINTKRG